MAITAGKAVVPFVGDFSALEQGALQSVTKIGKLFSSGSTGLFIGVAASVLAVGSAAIDMAAKYATSTDRMAAAADITIAQAKKIGDAFLNTAGTTTFSASEIMSAFAPVAGQLRVLNGGALNAAQSLTFMRAAMALAEATGQPLSDVTRSLASVMSTYSIKVDDAAKASDLLFTTSSALGVPVSTLASTVNRLKTNLGPLAPSLDDVSTLLLDLADHGLSGSRGLLAVSGGLNTLLGGSKKTEAEVKKLGLTLYDTNGNFVGMQSIIQQLAPKLAGMTEEQQLNATAALLGAGASKKMIDTILAGLPGWDAASNAVNTNNAAVDASRKATDNAGSAWKTFTSAVADWLTKGGAPFQRALTGIIDWMTTTALPDFEKFAAWFGKNVVTPFMDFADKTVPVIVGVLGTLVGWINRTGALGPIMESIAVGFVAFKLATAGAWLIGVGQALWAAAAGMGALDAAMYANPIALIAVGFAALGSAIFDIATNGPKVAKLIAGPLTDGMNGIKHPIDAIAGGLEAAWRDVLLLGGAIGQLPHIADIAFNGLVSGIKLAVNTVVNIINTLISGIDSVMGTAHSLGFGPNWSIPKIPNWKAEGGYFPTPRVIGVGDVPEFVMNVPQVSSLIQTAQASGAGGGGGITYAPVWNVTGYTDAQLLARLEATDAQSRAQLLLRINRRLPR